MDTDVHPLSSNEQHSPISSSSVVSDKENNNSTRDMLMSQRVKSIVNEFNKIASEGDAIRIQPAFSRQNPLNHSMNFQRQGFRNGRLIFRLRRVF